MKVIEELGYSLKDLKWHSDWSGYELGYDSVSVIGDYSSPDSLYSFYIDVENNVVLEVHRNEE